VFVDVCSELKKKQELEKKKYIKFHIFIKFQESSWVTGCGFLPSLRRIAVSRSLLNNLIISEKIETKCWFFILGHFWEGCCIMGLQSKKKTICKLSTRNFVFSSTMYNSRSWNNHPFFLSSFPFPIIVQINIF